MLGQLSSPGELTYVIGQSLSLVAVVLGFIAYQMKTSRAILAMEIVISLVFSAHYFLIGALTATALNFLSAIQCVAYYLRDRRGSHNAVIPCIFTALVVATSILTWDNWYSVFIMLGLTAYSVSIALHSAKIIRYTVLFKSPMCLLYNALALSVGGIIYECAILTSAVTAIIKNRGKEARAENGQV